MGRRAGEECQRGTRRRDSNEKKTHIIHNPIHRVLDLSFVGNITLLPHQIPPLHGILSLLVGLLDVQDGDLGALPHHHLRQDPAQPGASARDDHDFLLPLDVAMLPVREAVVDVGADLQHAKKRRVAQRVVCQRLPVYVQRRLRQVEDEDNVRVEHGVGQDPHQ